MKWYEIHIWCFKLKSVKSNIKPSFLHLSIFFSLSMKWNSLELDLSKVRLSIFAPCFFLMRTMWKVPLPEKKVHQLLRRNCFQRSSSFCWLTIFSAIFCSCILGQWIYAKIIGFIQVHFGGFKYKFWSNKWQAMR